MIIKFKPKDATKGFKIIVSSGQTTRYPNNTYSIGKEHLELLKKAGIDYEVVEK